MRRVHAPAVLAAPDAVDVLAVPDAALVAPAQAITLAIVTVVPADAIT